MGRKESNQSIEREELLEELCYGLETNTLPSAYYWSKPGNDPTSLKFVD